MPIWYTQISQCFENPDFLNGKHIFPSSLRNSQICDNLFIMLSSKCEQTYFMYTTYLIFHGVFPFIFRFKIGIF